MVYRKFHNHITTEYCKWAGKVVTFHSNKEKTRWDELNLAQVAGQIKDLERQTPFKFYHYHWSICEEVMVRGKPKLKRVKPLFLCTYIADFTYYENGKFVVEDSKGVKTPVYNLKKKMMEIWYSVSILET